MKTILAISSIALGAAAFASTGASTSSLLGADDSQCGSTCGSTVAKASLASTSFEDKTIVETAVGAGNFNTLARLLGQAELVEALSGEGPFTVFAPTDDAFAKIDEKTVKSLLMKENKGLLQDILKFHVVSGSVMAEKVVELKNATTLNGQRVGIRVDEGTVYLNDAKVTVTDIKCSNGVIHVIDTVIMPVTNNIVEVAAGAKTFNTLIAAAKAAGLVDALTKGGDITVFAPTDDAFAALPKGTVEGLLKPENKEQLASILKHHVVAGRVYADQAAKLKKAETLNGTEVMIDISDKGAKVGGANIVATDIQATNGVIHVIDAVILP